MAVTTPPTRELGYAVGFPGDFWMLDTETTPELRWPLSSRVYEMMRRQDAQITSVLRAVSLPVRRTTWRLDPNGARDEVVQLVADDLRLPVQGQDALPQSTRAKGRFSWGEHLSLALLMIQYGHMFFEQVYRIDDQGFARLAKLAPRMPRTISSIRVARDGGLEAISQYAMGLGSNGQYANAGSGANADIPVSRLVAYIHDREAGNWIGNSLLRPAYKHWIIKDRLLRVQAQTIERNGMGVPVYQAGPNDEKDDIELGRKMASAYRSGDSSGAAVPNGALLRLLGVEGALPDANPAIRYHDEQIGRAVLAHFLNLGTQTGSWALGSTFADFFVMSLQTLAQQVADTANQHVVEDLVDLNFGEDEPAPRIVFDEIGSRHDAVAPALKMLVDAGLLTPDEAVKAAIRQAYGLPAPSPNADPAPAEPAPAVPPTPTTGTAA